jgi:hypothetical protein
MLIPSRTPVVSRQIANFAAEVVLTPSSDGTITLAPHPIYDPTHFANLRQLSTVAGREGYNGACVPAIRCDSVHPAPLMIPPPRPTAGSAALRLGRVHLVCDPRTPSDACRVQTCHNTIMWPLSPLSRPPHATRPPSARHASPFMRHPPPPPSRRPRVSDLRHAAPHSPGAHPSTSRPPPPTRHLRTGGLRLLQAALHRFFLHCRRNDVDLPGDRGFTAHYHTTVPRQVGLAGSSAIVTAFMKAVLAFYGA